MQMSCTAACAEQVAYGLVGFWDNILDANDQRQPQTGLTKLLEKYRLAPHTTKKGKCVTALSPHMCSVAVSATVHCRQFPQLQKVLNCIQIT